MGAQDYLRWRAEQLLAVSRAVEDLRAHRWELDVQNLPGEPVHQGCERVIVVQAMQRPE